MGAMTTLGELPGARRMGWVVGVSMDGYEASAIRGRSGLVCRGERWQKVLVSDMIDERGWGGVSKCRTPGNCLHTLRMKIYRYAST